MSDLLAYLIAFAVHTTGLPQPAAQPTIQTHDKQALTELACTTWQADGFPSRESCLHLSIAAFYIPSTNTIHMRRDLDPTNDEVGASFLLHELVHWLQAGANPRLLDSCQTTLQAERQAYGVQNAYLKHRGQLFQAGWSLRFMTCS